MIRLLFDLFELFGVLLDVAVAVAFALVGQQALFDAAEGLLDSTVHTSNDKFILRIL
jgi:hypothetical protein